MQTLFIITALAAMAWTVVSIAKLAIDFASGAIKTRKLRQRRNRCKHWRNVANVVNEVCHES